MLMVVFGAGASYDSYSVIPPPSLREGQVLPDGYAPHFGDYMPYRPPLTNEIFARKSFIDEVLPKLPALRELQSHLGVLRKPPDGSLEQELERIRDQADQRPELKRDLLAVQFYLHVLLWHAVRQWTEVTKGPAATTYADILKRVQQATREGEDVLLVTFNYDTMLEAALNTRGVAIGSIPAYVATNYKVIKLHGSVNWAHPVRTAVDTRDGTTGTLANLIRMAGELDIDYDTFIYLRETDFFSYPAGILDGETRPVNVPAIAIPILSKKNYECPQDHLRLLETSLPNVTKVLLIGWRAAEEHFLGLLRAKLRKDARLMVISSGRPGADQVVANLRRAAVAGNYTPSAATGFTGLLQSHEIDEFLKE